MITQLNHETLSVIRQAIGEHLKPLERSLGVKLTTGSISYGVGKFTIKMDGVLIECGPAGESGAKIEFERYAADIDVPPSWYGKSVMTSHGEATVTDIVSSNRKYPIIATLSDGRRIKMDIGSAKRNIRL